MSFYYSRWFHLQEHISPFIPHVHCWHIVENKTIKRCCHCGAPDKKLHNEYSATMKEGEHE